MGNFFEPAFTIDETRPIWTLVFVLCGALAVWWTLQAMTTGWRWREQLAWRSAWRVVGWLPTLAACGALIIAWLGSSTSSTRLEGSWFDFLSHSRMVESLIPLAIGLQAAFLFSPDDEPALEVVIACPRPLGLLLMERLLVLCALQSTVALAGTLLTVTQTETPVVIAFLRWLAPSVFLSGLGMWITLRSRSATLGVMLVGLAGLVLIASANAFIPGQMFPAPFHVLQSFGWGLHPYMQPNALVWTDYLLNRGVVIAVGVVLIGLTMLEIRNTEKILFDQRSK